MSSTSTVGGSGNWLEMARFKATPKSIKGKLSFRQHGSAAWPKWGCYTLERPWRDNMRRKSCIPAGRYELVQRKHGQYFKNYKRRFDHQFVVEIAGVEGRSHILIHIGNYPKNSLGCVLVGKDAPTPDFVAASTETYKKFYEWFERTRPEYILIEDKYE